MKRIETTQDKIYIKGEKSGSAMVTLTCDNPISVKVNSYSNNLKGIVDFNIDGNETNAVIVTISYEDLYLNGETYSGKIDATTSTDSLSIPVIINCSDTLIYVNVSGNDDLTLSYNSLPEVNKVTLVGSTTTDISNRLTGSYPNPKTISISSNERHDNRYVIAENGLSQVALRWNEKGYSPESPESPDIPTGFSNEIYRYKNHGDGTIKIALKYCSRIYVVGGTIPQRGTNIANVEAIRADTGELINLTTSSVEGDSGLILWTYETDEEFVNLRLKITPLYTMNNPTYVQSPYSILFANTDLIGVVGDIILPAIDESWWGDHEYAQRPYTNNEYILYSFFMGSKITKIPIVRINDPIHPIQKSEGYAGFCNSCYSLTDLTNLSNIVDEYTLSIHGFFSECRSLTDLTPIANWNTSNVTDMRGMFYRCTLLTDLTPLSNWNTGNVKDMGTMFTHCTRLVDVSGLQNWDTGNVTDMGRLFSYCNSLADLSGLQNWDTGNVTDFGDMFLDCNSLADLSGLQNWDTSSVTNMEWVFDGCTSLTDISGLQNWDTSSVTTIFQLFAGCDSLTDLTPLANWDTSSVTTMQYAFAGCDNLRNLTPLANWDTSSVVNMYGLFNGCKKLVDVSALADWDTSSVGNVGSMFSGCGYLERVNVNWDLGNVNSDYSLVGMFYDCVNLQELTGLKNIKYDFDLSSCPYLTHESILDVINNLVPNTNPNISPMLRINSLVDSKLTADDVRIATDKGWVIVVA